MTKKEISFLICCLCLPLTGLAQTARWLLKPAHKSIAPFAESLFKVADDLSMCIVNTDGEKLVEADSITFINEGYAVALKNQNAKFRLTAVINERGEMTAVDEELFVTNYPFFSDGRLLVSNKKGRFGYVNIQGKLVIPCEYKEAYPFREGFASVKEGKKPAYIDAEGKELVMQLPKKTKLETAMSFKGGKAFLKAEKGCFFLAKNGTVVETAMPAEGLFADDYYALSGPTKQQEANLPYKPNYATDITVFKDDALLGYRDGDGIMLPAQFDEASGFANDRAIVKLNGNYGILQLFEGTVNINVSERGGKLTVKAIVPAEWDDMPAKLIRTIDNSQRMSFQLEGLTSQRNLETEVPAASGQRDYELEIDDLLVWQQDGKPAKTDSDSGKRVIGVSVPGRVKANGKGVCMVSVRVTNRSDSKQTITVSLSTGGRKTVTVAAGASGTVSIPAKVAKETRCTVTARCAAGTGYGSTTLVPAFIL